MTVWGKIVSYYRRAFAVSGTTPDGAPESSWSDWLWPIPEMHGVQPTISDGFGVSKRGGAGHFGADIMYWRGKEVHPEQTNREGQKNRLYAIWQGTPAILAGPGRVYDNQMTKTGRTVRVSHRVNGRPIMSVYRHLMEQEYALVKKGAVLPAGTPLGLVYDNPASKGDPPHLHFELWDTAQNNVSLFERFRKSAKGGEYLRWVFDPARVMPAWNVLRWEDRNIVPYTGTIPKPDGSGTSGGGGGIVAGVGGVLSAIALMRLIISRRGTYGRV